MPAELDPAWEYWVPDPEIAEAMGDHDDAADFSRLPMVDTANGTPRSDGFRFGRTLAGVNADFTRLAPGLDPGVTVGPERTPGQRKPRPLVERVCEGCRKGYRTDRPKQRYCSRSCGGTGRRTLPTWACATCGTTFRSSNPNPRYCSVKCRGKNSRGRVELDFQRVLALKAAGLSVKSIARELGASVSTVERTLAAGSTTC